MCVCVHVCVAKLYLCCWDNHIFLLDISFVIDGYMVLSQGGCPASFVVACAVKGCVCVCVNT